MLYRCIEIIRRISIILGYNRTRTRFGQGGGELFIRRYVTLFFSIFLTPNFSIGAGETVAGDVVEEQKIEENGSTETPATEDGGETEEAKKKKKKRKPRGKGGKQQTDPPTIPIAELFPDGNFPEGQIMEHPSAAGVDDRTAKNRFSSEEARALDRMQNDIYNEARHAAEAHRQTRKHIMNWVCFVAFALVSETPSISRRFLLHGCHGFEKLGEVKELGEISTIFQVLPNSLTSLGSPASGANVVFG